MIILLSITLVYDSDPVIFQINSDKWAIRDLKSVLLQEERCCMFKIYLRREMTNYGEPLSPAICITQQPENSLQSLHIFLL